MFALTRFFLVGDIIDWYDGFVVDNNLSIHQRLALLDIIEEKGAEHGFTISVLPWLTKERERLRAENKAQIERFFLAIG